MLSFCFIRDVVSSQLAPLASCSNTCIYYMFVSISIYCGLHSAHGQLTSTCHNYFQRYNIHIVLKVVVNVDRLKKVEIEETIYGISKIARTITNSS